MEEDRTDRTDDEEPKEESWFDQFFSLSSSISPQDIDVLGFISDDGEASFKKAVKLEHALDDTPRDIHKALALYSQAEENGHPTARDARLRLEARLPYYKQRAIAAANMRDKLALYRQSHAVEQRKQQLEQVPHWLDKRRALKARDDSLVKNSIE